MRVTQSPGLPGGFRFATDLAEPLALRPLGVLSGMAARAAVEAGMAEWLAGPPLAFTAAELLLSHEDGGLVTTIAPLGEIRRWAEEEGEPLRAAVDRLVARISGARRPFAGMTLDRPRVIGVVNVTPDSFYDGGAHVSPASAIAQGRALHMAGADMIDVGGESTRPGSAPVPEDLELDRVIPVVVALVADGIPVSVDTRRPAVMRLALAAGAQTINDVTALAAHGAIDVVAEAGASAVLMHMQGEPASMQDAPHYDHAPWDVYRFLEARIAACEAAGIPRERLAVDPGIGFGKSLAHNLSLIDSFALFHGLGCAVMAGVSRKSFIAHILPATPAQARLPGTLAATMLASGAGVQLHRVHDAAEAVQALAVWRAATGS